MSAIESAKVGDKIPEAQVQVLRYPTDLIDPSPYQARKHFPQEGIDEMAASVALHGIIQPLIGRVVDPAGVRIELVCGERRWRGAKQAGQTDVPLIVRELSDTQAEEIMLIENLQREDLSASEEAGGYERMLKLRGADNQPLYTVEGLAGKLNKNIAHITARLKLLLCPKEMIEAVDNGRVSVTTAMLVGRIPDPKARAKCAKRVLEPETQEVPLNYVQTKELIRTCFAVRLNKADFNLDDEMLVPVRKDEAGQRCLGGACTDCPFRSGNIEGVEVQASTREKGAYTGTARGTDPNMCTLPKCHGLKLDAAWREKKEATLKKGGKVLDGEAAVEAFSGLNGDLANDADYVHPDTAVNDTIGGVYVSTTWANATYGQKITAVVARHPETKQVLQVYAREDAVAAVRINVEAMLEKQRQQQPEAGAKAGSADIQTGDDAGEVLTLESGTSLQDDEALAREKSAAEAKAKEAEQAKVDKIAVHEAVTDLINLITEKGVGVEFYDHLFQMALTHSGADGMHFLGHFFEIKLPDGADRGGRVYEEAIIKLVKERAETPNAWLAYITAALIARQVKWNGIASDDLEACLQWLGVKVADIKRRAQALRAVEKKAGKGKEPKPKAKGTSTDPVEVSADKESALSQAADAVAGDDRVVFREYTAVPADIPLLLKDLLELEIPVTEPNPYGVFVRRGVFHIQASKQVSFDFELAHTVDGRWSYGYTHEAWPPQLGGGSNPTLDDVRRSRAEAVMATAVALLRNFESRGDAPGKHQAALADTLNVLRAVKKTAAAALEEWLKSEPVGTVGLSASEVANGVQDSKIGKPATFTEEDVARAAQCIVAGTTDGPKVLGPKPKPAEKEALKVYNRVRLQLRRAVEKLGQGAPKPAIQRDFKSDICTRCGVMIEDEDEQVDHLNGPDCGEA